MCNKYVFYNIKIFLHFTIDLASFFSELSYNKLSVDILMMCIHPHPCPTFITFWCELSLVTKAPSNLVSRLSMQSNCPQPINTLNPLVAQKYTFYFFHITVNASSHPSITSNSQLQTINLHMYGYIDICKLEPTKHFKFYK